MGAVDRGDGGSRRRARRAAPALIGAAALLCALVAGCGRSAAPGHARGVVVIAIDGLRPGAARAPDAPPVLAGLARDAVAFDDALTPAPLELPALASLLSGLDPRRHGARDDGATSVLPGVRNLAQILREHGFRARAAVSSAALTPGGGLERGFESFDAPAPSHAPVRIGFEERRGEATVDRALAALDELARDGAPFLLLVHLAEPRAPFAPPDVPASAPEAARYAGEVRAVDRQLGRLLTALEAGGLLDEIVLVVTALRAAAPGAEDGAEPGETLAADVMRVPLLLLAPGLAPRRVAGPVSLVDVVPTILTLLGVPPPPDLGELDGRNLVPAMRTGTTTPGRVLALESWHPWLSHGLAPLAGVVRDDLWLVRGATTSLREPLSPRELYRADDARSRGMLAELERRFGPPDPAWPADEVGAAAHLERLAAARALLRAGVLSRERLGLDELAREAPDDPTAAGLLASMLLASPTPAARDVERAEPLVERALVRRPDDPRLLELLARCAAARATEARRALAAAESRGPESAIRAARARVDAERARRIGALERALARTPADDELRAVLERARLE
jgi:arylsulfatase A-like enzyme